MREEDSKKDRWKKETKRQEYKRGRHFKKTNVLSKISELKETEKGNI